MASSDFFESLAPFTFGSLGSLGFASLLPPAATSTNAANSFSRTSLDLGLLKVAISLPVTLANSL